MEYPAKLSQKLALASARLSEPSKNLWKKFMENMKDMVGDIKSHNSCGKNIFLADHPECMHSLR